MDVTGCLLDVCHRDHSVNWNLNNFEYRVLIPLQVLEIDIILA